MGAIFNGIDIHQNHAGYAAIQNVNAVDEHKSNTARNSAFDCKLFPVGDITW